MHTRSSNLHSSRQLVSCRACVCVRACIRACVRHCVCRWTLLCSHQPVRCCHMRAKHRTTDAALLAQPATAAGSAWMHVHARGDGGGCAGVDRDGLSVVKRQQRQRRAMPRRGVIRHRTVSQLWTHSWSHRGSTFSILEGGAEYRFKMKRSARSRMAWPFVAQPNSSSRMHMCIEYSSGTIRTYARTHARTCTFASACACTHVRART